MARHLRDEGIDPELVLCSPARRARETLKGIEPALSRRTVRIEPGVYGAASETLLELVQALPDSVASVMVIGHNPSLEDLALELARKGDLVGELAAKYPTGALATLAFAGPGWADLAPGQADLVAFVPPRELEAAPPCRRRPTRFAGCAVASPPRPRRPAPRRAPRPPGGDPARAPRRRSPPPTARPRTTAP